MLTKDDYLPNFPLIKTRCSYSKKQRNNPRSLRNQFFGVGKYGIPMIRKPSEGKLHLKYLQMIACTNTTPNDKENFDKGVHFFVDDYRFESIYENPNKTFKLYSQYSFCCTPDFSLYREMPLWRQIESVAKNRWCGAWWQAHGMLVVPTISWGNFQTFEFCFDGVEKGGVVAIATYACRKYKLDFMRGYDEMLRKIEPKVIICYGIPFKEMRGNVICVPVSHPRQFHHY